MLAGSGSAWDHILGLWISIRADLFTPYPVCSLSPPWSRADYDNTIPHARYMTQR